MTTFVLTSVAMYLVDESAAFTAPIPSATQMKRCGPGTYLEMSKSERDLDKKAAASAVAAAFIVSGILSADSAFAMTPHVVGSTSNTVAARSGGRAGGRAMGGGAAIRSGGMRGGASYRGSYGGGRTTVITPVRPMIAPPVVISPFGGFGYGYNPLGGFGLGYGMGAIGGGGIGGGMREYRQEEDIARSKAELEVAKQKEAELEARIRALEAGQVAPEPVAPQEVAQ